MRKAYPAIPRKETSSFGGIKDEAYMELLRRTILNNANPENVILREIEPEKQKHESTSRPRKHCLAFARFA
jgi:hypothetical protein